MAPKPYPPPHTHTLTHTYVRFRYLRKICLDVAKTKFLFSCGSMYFNLLTLWVRFFKIFTSSGVLYLDICKRLLLNSVLGLRIGLWFQLRNPAVCTITSWKFRNQFYEEKQWYQTLIFQCQCRQNANDNCNLLFFHSQEKWLLLRSFIYMPTYIYEHIFEFRI